MANRSQIKAASIRLSTVASALVLPSIADVVDVQRSRGRTVYQLAPRTPFTPRYAQPCTTNLGTLLRQAGIAVR